MSATITLPRADAEQIRAALVSGEKLFAALSALAAALAEPDAKPEPATEEQIIHSWPTELPYLSAHNAFYKGFRAAERFHGIKKEDK